MERFTTHIGRVVALPRVNVDTDQIIPKQFLRSIERIGFGAVLFHDWRYATGGALNPEFELNRPEAAHASVLLAGANFGCGSSREHAAWALADFGFRCIIAESFGDIFQANCSQNGILPITLSSAAIHELFRRCTATPGYELSIDLESRLVRDRQGFAQGFDIDPYRRAMLLSGQDEIGKTLMLEDRIAAFEQRS